MKRRTTALLIAGLLVVAGLASRPWALAEQTLQQNMLAKLSQQFGVEVRSASDGAFALLPTPRIIATDVAVSANQGRIEARLPRIRAEIRLLALLAGRIEFDHIRLFSPQVEVDVVDGQFDLTRLANIKVPAGLGPTPRVTVTGHGAMFFRQGPGIISAVRDIALDVARRDVADTFEIEGSARWRGEPVSFAVALQSEASVIRPTLRFASDLIRIDFQAGSQAAKERLDGQLDLGIPSFSRLSNWLGGSSAALVPALSARFRGRLEVQPEAFALRDAGITLGADTLEGVLDWRRRDGRWTITGTVAGKVLDLSQVNSGLFSTAISPRGEFGQQTLPFGDLFSQDVDLRLSLGRVRMGGATLDEVAAQLMVASGRAELSVTNAGFYRGAARGRFSLANKPDGLQVRQQVTIERVDLGQLSAALSDGRRLTGTGFLAVQLEARGKSVADIVHSAAGRFSFSARSGEVAGANFPDLLRRIEQQPLAALQTWRGGRSSFDQLAVSGVVGQGQIEFNDATLAGPGYRIQARSSASLHDFGLEGRGMLEAPQPGVNVPFALGGTLFEPRVQPDVNGLILRSRAAAPLIGARPIEN